MDRAQVTSWGMLLLSFIMGRNILGEVLVGRPFYFDALGTTGYPERGEVAIR
ncbi:MAG: hypothetical protein ACR2PG_14445 [Hyphomicrobiaceae bacterium]